MRLSKRVLTMPKQGVYAMPLKPLQNFKEATNNETR